MLMLPKCREESRIERASARRGLKGPMLGGPLAGQWCSATAGSRRSANDRTCQYWLLPLVGESAVTKKSRLAQTGLAGMNSHLNRADRSVRQ